jgi:hypothetical protein
MCGYGFNQFHCQRKKYIKTTSNITQIKTIPKKKPVLIFSGKRLNILAFFFSNKIKLLTWLKEEMVPFPSHIKHFSVFLG